MTRLSAAVLFLVSLAVSVVLAAEPQVFKNSDLDKYSGGSATQATEPPQPSDNTGKQHRGTVNGSVASEKYWCDMATASDNRIKRAEENLSNAKSKRAEAWRKLNSGNRYAAVEADAQAQRDQENAEAELAEAKQEKERLQDDARQKNIPSGWLRCQFE
ncbi:MAG: hypothetical protein WA610_16085 [Thermodesulfovibrionales bacterium]